MGNNQAFTTFQQTVINLSNSGHLDLDTLDKLAEQYRGTDIDSGGDSTMVAKDGKTLEEICIAIVDPQWRESREDDTWHEERSDKWAEITDERWGWE